MAKSGKITSFIDLAAFEKEKEKLITGLDVILKKIEKISQTKLTFSSTAGGGIKTVTDETNKLTEAERQLKKETEELAKLSKKKADLDKDHAKKVAELKQQISNKNRVTKIEVNTNKEIVGAYNALKGSLQKAKDEYKNLAAAGKGATAQAQKLKAQIDKLDASIKKVDKDVGEHQKNVGNYGSALDKVKGQAMAMGAAMLAAFSVGAVKSFVRDSLVAYDKQVNAVEGLRAVLIANGKDANNLTREYKKFASGLQDITKIGDETTLGIMRLGETMGVLDLKQATKDSIGLSAALGIDLTASMKMVALAGAGDFNMLNRYVPALKMATSETEKAAIATKLFATGFELAQSQAKEGLGPAQQLANAWGDFMEKMGRLFLPILNKFVRGLGSIVGVLNDWLAIPVSEELDKELVSINNTIGAITSLNEESELRNKILSDLMKAYPTYFKNLNAETTTNEELLVILKEINLEYETRIALAVAEEDITANMKKGLEIFKEQRDIVKAIDKNYKLYVGEIREGMTLAEKVVALQTEEAQARAKLQAAKRAFDTEDNLSINGLITKFNELGKGKIINQEEYNALIKTQIELQGNIVPGGGGDGGGGGGTDKESGIAKQTSLIAKLDAEVAGLTRSFEDQILAGDMNASATATQIKGLKKLIATYKELRDAMLGPIQGVSGPAVIGPQNEIPGGGVIPAVQGPGIAGPGIEEFKAQGELENEVNEQLRQDDLDKELMAWNKKAEMAREFTQQIQDVVNMFYEAKFAYLDAEDEKDEVEKERELERAGNNMQKKNEIEEKFAQKQKERDKERRRLEIAQAKFNKTFGIISAVINMAVGITKALVDPGGILGIVVAALAAATGIASIALIAAQPIPSYSTGRRGGQGEYALVGEAGTERIDYPGGGSAYTSGETVTWLPPGADVVPNHELVDALGRRSLSGDLPRWTESRTEAVDFAGTNARLDLLTRVIKDKKEMHLNITKRGMQVMAQSGSLLEEYLNDNVRL